MRNYLILFVGLFLISNTYANFNSFEPVDSNCRPALVNAAYYPTLTMKIKSDLLSGIWEHQFAIAESVSDMKEICEFLDNGQLKRTTIFDNGHAMVNYNTWRIEETEGEALLVIYDEEIQEEIYYHVSQNCEGVVLTDVNTLEKTFFAFSKAIKPTALKSIQLMVAGEWSSDHHTFESEKCKAEHKGTHFIDFNFDADGRFTRVVGNQTDSVIAKGFWEISKDGNYLMLSFSTNGTLEGVYTTQYARLRQLNGREMVIEHSLTTVGEFEDSFQSADQLFTFNRAVTNF